MHGGARKSRGNAARVAGVAVPAILTVAMCGCVAMPSQPVQISYSEAEFGAYKASGDATVYGQAFLRQQGGGVVVCAGEPVVLFPHTPSFERVVGLARQHIQPVFPDTADPRFKQVARRATCDAQGNFRFTGLPRAKWYVYSRVRWSVGDFGQQGGDLIGEVDTSGGGEQQVLLTDANRI
jgi:hypothetical protein